MLDTISLFINKTEVKLKEHRISQLQKHLSRCAKSATLMKALATIVFFVTLASCKSTRVVTMPYRNYELSAERLMPLSYSDAWQSIRVWISSSTSVDTVFTVSQNVDSSYSAFQMGIGHKYKGSRTSTPYFSQIKVQPVSGFPVFFQSLDSLNLFAFKDQKERDIVLHEPIAICIVEYLKDKKYTKFSFRWNLSSGTEQDNYQAIESFIKREFNLEEGLR